MTDNTVKAAQKLTAANTQANAMSALIETMLHGRINTAGVVKVVKVYPGGPQGAAGYLDALPLVCQTDADGNMILPATLYRLPYSRIQGGIAALVIDPVPGDIGLAVFTKRDSSAVGQGQQSPVRPASFRTFDQSDGFYIGGFLNQAPEIWLELNQEKEATLHAPVKVTVNTTNAVVNASAKVLLDTPETELTGNLFVQGNVTWAGIGQGYNGSPAIFQGGLENTGGTVTSNNITLETHTHSGVEPGPGNSGGPNTG